MSQFRHFTFTHNNYDGTEVEDAIDCRYIIYGKEVGESGTPHLQGFISFKEKKSLKQLIKLLPGCHVEVARVPEAAIEYCKKEGQVTERGVAPVFDKKEHSAKGGDATKRKWEDMWELAKTNKIEEIDAEERIKHYRTFRQIQKDYGAKADDLEVESGFKGILWIYGSPGSGKSRWVRETYPRSEVYDKTLNKWWDGYNGEPIVLLDDFGKAHGVLGEHIKRWGDRYSFPAEIKGGKLDIRPQRIIVTSNYTPDQIWEEPMIYQAIMRRTEMKFMFKEGEI